MSHKSATDTYKKKRQNAHLIKGIAKRFTKDGEAELN